MEMEDDTRVRCVLMCKHFHESVRRMSEKFEKEIKRCNYVTPTSYLELILTFKSLLKGKRDDILNLKTRYEMGLGKLEFASSQVTVMQNELTALRPQLLETSDETEKLMIKIEQDTIQVEAKKEIVACDEALANEAAAAAQAIRCVAIYFGTINMNFFSAEMIVRMTWPRLSQLCSLLSTLSTLSNHPTSPWSSP